MIDVGVGRRHAVREAGIGLQGGLAQNLHSKPGTVVDRDDLVVLAMHDEHRHVDDLEVLGEVRLREGLDAVVVRLGAAHHALAPPVADEALRDLRAWPVEAVEGPGGDIEEELRPVRRQRRPQPVEGLDGLAARVRRRFQHDRRDRTDQHRLGRAAFPVTGHVARHLAAAGGVADMDRVLEIEMSHQVGDVGRVGVHLVAVSGLCGASVSAPIMSDHAKTLVEEKQHLRVPLVGRRAASRGGRRWAGPGPSP